jgi:hypothetical protein
MVLDIVPLKSGFQLPFSVAGSSGWLLYKDGSLFWLNADY